MPTIRHAQPLAWLAAFVLTGSTGIAAEVPSFNRDVRPILSDKCYFCHGPDSNQRQAGLRLDVRDSALSELDSGATAIVPGKPAESELIRRVVSTDEFEQMPPADAKIGRLTPDEIDTLRRWIDAGAEYESHWTFLPFERANPDVAANGEMFDVRPRNLIDGLVFSRLKARGWSPAPEADRRTLIRRVTFDLTGLPPTAGEVAAFVNDRRPDAYERLVDRLLASPRYGERMTADWLDVARYADSYGFQVDREREVWPWRDWVIASFNANQRWDDFVTWQLAGDLLPDATDDQILATAFNRLHQQESEGGSIVEEYRVNYVNDRVVTFGTAFLGLTLECASCHDHKFDPISQREYYQLFAFFDDIDEAGLYSYFTDATPTPTLRLLNNDQKQRLDDAGRAAADAEARLASLAHERNDAFERWLNDRPAPPETIAGEIARFSFDTRNDEGGFDSSVAAASAKSPAANELVEGRFGKAVRLTGDHAVTTTVGNFHRYEPFSVSLWLKMPEISERAVVFHRSRAWTDAGSRGYELLLEDGRLRWSLIHFWPGNAVSVQAVEPLPVGEWVHVTVTSDGSSRADGLQLSVNGQSVATRVVRDALTKDVTGGGGDTIALGERFRDRGFAGGLVDDFRVFDRELTPLEMREMFAAGTIESLLHTPPAMLADTERSQLREFYFATVDEPSRKQRAALQSAREALNRLDDAAREIMVMRELPEPKTAYILQRGEYQNRGESVEPETPAALPPFPDDQPRNRLGLARWLTDPQHPLLARVTVNRFWQACFGRGLVETPEDLGSQSDLPVYPELLDSLSAEFVESGWNVKRLLRTIVTSHVYRQSSQTAPERLADDPENAWLSRGPRHRLPAEMIRDGALVASELLVERIGGPPVRTYDMPESFKPSKAGEGAELYRRSLYTFWRRTGPAPVLEAFGVPKRVVCTVQRDVNDTPLHALVLLNSTQFVEAARVLATELHDECGGQSDEMLARAFRRLTSRSPDETERAILRRMFSDQLAWYRDHPDEAKSYLSVGDRPFDTTIPPAKLAAATAVVNALMNYDGCVVKR